MIHDASEIGFRNSIKSKSNLTGIKGMHEPLGPKGITAEVFRFKPENLFLRFIPSIPVNKFLKSNDSIKSKG